MSDVLFLLIGMCIGGVVGGFITWLRAKAQLAPDAIAANATIDELRIQLAQRDSELTQLRQAFAAEQAVTADGKARLESAREHFAEQRRQIAEMEQKVKDSFGALSAEALKNSNEQFVTMAEGRLKPVREQLERYETQIKELEKHRAEAYGGLTKHLQSLQQNSERLSSETSQLVSALRQPGAKGKWGEVTLLRIVEMLGMSAQCDFETQATLENRLRPDMLVKLPGGRTLAIDSKVNTSAYLDAVNAELEDQRNACMAKFVSDVRTTVKNLAAREYWKQLTPSPEFVVMFMPGEAFFAAAVTAEPDLLTQSADQKVILASPTTLIALLLAVRHGWQQQQVADNAQRIADAGRALYDKLCVFASHLETIRSGLYKAAEGYNKAIGSWTTNAMPGARRLKELGAAEMGKEVEEPAILDTILRAAPSPEEPDNELRQIA